MMALRRPALVGAGMVAVTRPPARRAAVDAVSMAAVSSRGNSMRNSLSQFTPRANDATFTKAKTGIGTRRP